MQSPTEGRRSRSQPGTGGKILVAGSSGGNFALARYNANGTLDTTFGTGGKVVTDMAIRQAGHKKGSDNYGSRAEAMAVQPDGRIVLAGFADDDSPGVTNYLVLARYNANGALDATFGSSGKVVTDIPVGGGINTYWHFLGVAVGGDGKIVLAGGTHSTTTDFLVARFNPNGTPDTAFGAGGRVFTDFGGGDDGPQGVALQPDGKILAVGWTNPAGTDVLRFAMARYNPDGSLDSGFGQGGMVTTPVGSGWGGAANDVAIQADGKILAAGYAGRQGAEANDLALARYNPDGSLDPSYGGAGTGVAITAVGANASAAGLALQPDGGVILAGFTSTNGVYSLALARYLPSAPQIGSFTASPNPVAAGSAVTLSASNITDANPNSTIAQVAFYLDSNGDGILEPGTDALLGYGSLTNGVWTLTVSTTGWASGSDTLFARAQDSYGVFGDPLALDLKVM